MDSPAQQPRRNYLDMRKAEELYKNNLEQRQTSAQLLNEGGKLTKQLTLKIDKEAAEQSLQVPSSRSGQTYVRSNTKGRNDISEEINTHQKRNSLSKQRTIENIVNIVTEEKEEGLNNSNRFIGQKSNNNLSERPNSTQGEITPPAGNSRYGNHQAMNTGPSKTDVLGTSGNEENFRHTASFDQNIAGVNPIVAEKCAKVDRILADWQDRLAKTDAKLARYRGARTQLIHDIAQIEAALSNTNVSIAQKTSKLQSLDSLIAETRSTSDKMAASMQGLAAAISRELNTKYR
jgi:hypothetical protein